MAETFPGLPHKVPVITEAVIVEIGKLELGPGDMLWVKGDLNPEQARQLAESLSEWLAWKGKEGVVVMAGNCDAQVVRIPDDQLERLADRVAVELERRQERRSPPAVPS
jgi:leucyl aminopeptidase (aminopeptidase T)